MQGGVQNEKMFLFGKKIFHARGNRGRGEERDDEKEALGKERTRGGSTLYGKGVYYNKDKPAMS